MKKIALGVIFSALESLQPAVAQQLPVAPHANARAEYLVSGVLRSNADSLTIKLVQGVQVSRSRDEAIGGFTREVLDMYPGYSLIDALASPIPQRKSDCGKAI